MSWYLSVPWLVDVAVIMCLTLLFTSVIISAIPHYYMKDPSLTETSETLVMALIMCCYKHFWCSTSGCLAELVGPVPKYLTVQLLTLYFFVFNESVGGEVIEFSYFLMKSR